MGRRSAELAMTAPGAEGRGRNFLRYTLVVLLLILGAFAAMVVVWKVEQFLITDSRFFLPGPPDPGQKSLYFHVIGAQNTSEQQIVQVFARDFGRSLYLCPISERRARLLGLDWVKEASVSRVWPNRLIVRITERSPVAFVQVQAADRSLRPGLIDADGVLLQ